MTAPRLSVPIHTHTHTHTERETLTLTLTLTASREREGTASKGRETKNTRILLKERDGHKKRRKKRNGI